MQSVQSKIRAMMKEMPPDKVLNRSHDHANLAFSPSPVQEDGEGNVDQDSPVSVSSMIPRSNIKNDQRERLRNSKAYDPQPFEVWTRPSRPTRSSGPRNAVSRETAPQFFHAQVFQIQEE